MMQTGTNLTKVEAQCETVVIRSKQFGLIYFASPQSPPPPPCTLYSSEIKPCTHMLFCVQGQSSQTELSFLSPV